MTEVIMTGIEEGHHNDDPSKRAVKRITKRCKKHQRSCKPSTILRHSAARTKPSPQVPLDMTNPTRASYSITLLVALLFSGLPPSSTEEVLGDDEEDAHNVLPQDDEDYEETVGCPVWAREVLCGASLDPWREQTLRYHHRHVNSPTYCPPGCYVCRDDDPYDELVELRHCLKEELANNEQPHEDIWQAGDSDRMYERILREFADEYSPTVLSRPYYVNGDNEQTADYQIGPWVITLENFTTSEEDQAMVDETLSACVWSMMIDSEVSRQSLPNVLTLFVHLRTL